MRFHALLVVRDECDIVGQSTVAALQWADAIYVYDTGSTDGTWDILQELARQDSRIVLFRHEPVWFKNELRAVLFNRYRERAEPGDWFATLDADEFYHVAPPLFVQKHLRTWETEVCYQLYDFKLTKLESERLSSREAIVAERAIPIEFRRRHFIPLRYAEPRLFRYRPTMQWVPPKAPYNMGCIARERIPIRHYSNRDPIQMETKYRLRLPTRPYVGLSSSPHWQVTDYVTKLVDPANPELEYWHPGTELPSYRWTNHLASFPKQVLQRSVHFALLPVLDRLRPNFPAEYQAEAIAPEINEKIRVEPL